MSAIPDLLPLFEGKFGLILRFLILIQYSLYFIKFSGIYVYRYPYTPFLKMPPNFGDIVFKIRLSVLTPTLAHPERNREVRDNLRIMENLKRDMVDFIALIQLNVNFFSDINHKFFYDF